MNIYAPLSCYAMHAGDLLAIRRGGRRVIRCLHGTVLVSLQGCATDFDLAPGMAVAIDGNPLVLIESCTDARIAIDAPPPARRRHWPLLGLLPVVGLASALAAGSLPERPGTLAQRDTPVAACALDHEARTQAWRAGRGMLDASGLVATNRVIASYERTHAETCRP